VPNEDTLGEVEVYRGSEVADFGQCPLKRHMRWVLGYTTQAEDYRASLGTAWHEVLRWHYELIQDVQSESGGFAAGRHPSVDEVQSQISKRLDLVFIDTPYWETLRWMYEGYLESHGTDPHWEVISVEVTHQVPFLDRAGAPTWFLFEWTSDLLVQDRELPGEPIVMVDNKSTANPLGKVDIDLADQYGNYTWAWRRLGVDALMQVCNQTKTKKLKRPMTLAERNVRLPGYRTDQELRAIELDTLGKVEAIRTEANRTRPYSVTDPRVCSWKCEFTNVHLHWRKTGGNYDKLEAVLRMHGMEKRAVPRGSDRDEG
jgi:hypothetical protein